jgi:hypothetical protein
MKRSTLLFVGSVWLVAMLTGCARPNASEQADAPVDSGSLSAQSGHAGSLKAVFNEGTDKVRLMVLLSPT